MSANPVVFVVGCARSGTTLVRRVLDAHPDVAMTPETHWVGKLMIRSGGEFSQGLVDRLVAEYPVQERLWVTEDDLRGLVRNGPMPYARFASTVYDLYGLRRGKRLVGDKTPGYVMHMRGLHRMWPDAKFVHVVRDGRDVFLSARDWKGRAKLEQRFTTWRDDPAATGALWWKRRVLAGRESGRALGAGLYHELRYERLVGDPAGEIETLCAFLNLPHDGRMLRFHEGPDRIDRHGRRAMKAWKPIIRGLRDWRSQMTAEEVEMFEATAGDLLRELGYELGAPRIGPHAQARAAEVKAAFTADVRSVGHRLPSGW